MVRVWCRGLAVAALLSSRALAGVGPGDRAPDFTLQDVGGQAYSLSDFAGKVVLLAFVGYG